MTLLTILISAIASLFITTDNCELPTATDTIAPDGCWSMGITNKTEVTGKAIIVSEEGDTLYDSKAYATGISGINLRLRGNTSSLNHNKYRSYRLKLEKKYDLISCQNTQFSDKEWALVYPYEVNRYPGEHPLNMQIGYRAAELMEMAWIPRFRQVRVHINDEYQGIYNLIETVKQKRLNIANSGVIAELDPYWWNDEISIETNIFAYDICPLKYTFKYPKDEDLTDEFLQSWQALMMQAEDSMASGHYEEMIDVQSWAKWLLVHDILGSFDGAGSNMYFTRKDDTSKIDMPCIWDLDWIEGVEMTEYATVRNFFYFPTLLESENSLFRDTYNRLYIEKRDTVFQGIQLYLNELEQDAGEELRQAINRHRIWFEQREAYLSAEIGTSIHSVQHHQHARVYDIFGRDCGKTVPGTPGIYIQNGKKTCRY